LKREVVAALAETSLAAALWGTSFPVISVALRGGLDPGAFVFLRFALAAPPMIVVALLMKRDVVKLLRSGAVWIVAFFNAVGFVCQFIGQQYTEASVAALLVNMSVVLAAVGGAAFLGERMGAYKVSGVVLAFAGAALIAANGSIASATGGQLLGDGLYLLAAAAWAGYIVYAKKKTDEFSWDPVAVAAAIVTLTALFVLPAALLGHGLSGISTSSWGAIGYVAVFNTAIAFVLYQAGLRYLTASSSAVILMLEIVVAVAISVAFLGETFTVYSSLGAVAVLFSILLVSGVDVRGKSLSVSQISAKRAQVSR
jgi:drug/metabolite transporter (DMT)-like permease